MNDVRVSGPIFDGRAERAAGDISREITREVADVTYSTLQTTFNQVLKHPTGYYQSRIEVTVSGNEAEVDGDNVIYGHWLEGIGSRNRTTRFKGYFTFRKVTQRMQVRAEAIAERVVDRNLWRLR